MPSTPHGSADPGVGLSSVGAVRTGGAQRLIQSVPDQARTILQVGVGPGWLATDLKKSNPGRVVYGLALPGGPKVPSSTDLDEVFELDIAREMPSLEPGSIDTIVYADTLSRFTDPLALLELHRPLLSGSGTIVCSVPNLQHHSIVTQLLRGVFRYGDDGPVDRGHVHLFTFAGIVQLLLDAGYAPHVVDTTDPEATEGATTADILSAGAPLFEFLGVGVRDLDRHLRTEPMIVVGERQADVDPTEEVPLTFVVCVNDDAQLEANLLSSPCLAPGNPHELLVFRHCASAAEGLNAGIEQARNDLVVLVHQDVYLPKGWPARMVSQWHQAKRSPGDVGIGGLFGIGDRHVPFDSVGKLVHRERLLSSGSLPADVDGLDEVLMVVPRNTTVRFDATLGWDLYGTDAALQAHQQGLRVVVLDAPCHHNTLTNRVPTHYRDSERALARKWQHLLPLHTNLSSIGSWLLEDSGPDADQGEGPDSGPGEENPAVMAKIVTSLQAERAALSAELERARLEVASMQASPFWRARQMVVAWRDRLKHTR